MKLNRFTFFLMLAASALFFSCKSKKMIVNDGAEVVTSGVDEHIDGGTVSQTDQGVVLTFESDVLFATNSSYLSEKAKVTMKNMVAYINKNYPNANIQINGHTDSTGEEDYNQWLSEKRASSVKTYAVSIGLSENRVTTKGYGKSKPVATNSTAEGRQQNRRVEVIILK
ncbi:OmpA family protein [Olivibacter sp. SDN3]|uniref:OmpA family protein n=1 Tax=Olivibacter sp. SDN3 TaxID=2764720 RepID=UPI001651AB71|nr:OmpA family protein [Olivibacter sp. SDN3]QNL52287.1 OmpA family protein [Olivibacter sp. SDN3]